MLLLTAGSRGITAPIRSVLTRLFLEPRGLDPTGGVRWQKERVKTRAQKTIRYALG